MPKNHNTHSSHEAQPDKLELSDNMSRDELLEYYDGQLDRMARLGEALGRPEDEWTAKDGYYGGGNALSAYVDEIRDNLDYEVVGDDVRIARYMDASLSVVESYNAIDKTKLTEFYKIYATDFESAALRHIDVAHRSLERHNDKIDARIESGKKADSDEDLSRRDKKALKGTRRINSEILTDIGEVKRLLEGDTPDITTTEFIELRRRHAVGEVTDDDVKAARNDLIHNTYTLNHAADAYLLISGDDEHDFKNEDFISALNLDEDEMRAAKIASQQDARKEAAAESEKTSAPLPTPQNKAQRKAAQVSREQVDSQSDDATSGDSGTPPSPPVGGNHNQQSGGQDDPNGAQSRAINQLRQQAYEARVQAAKDQYDLAKYNLASISAKRSEFFGASRVQAQEAITAHQLFDEAIQELAELDPMMRAVMSNPELTLEERGAQINAFYVAKHAELRKATTEEMGNNWSNKGAEFIVRHKRKLKIGAVVLGGLTGGVGGVILGTAISVGAAKAAQHHAKQQKAFAAADNGAAGSLSFVNSAVSLEAVDAEAANHDEHSTDPAVLQRIAQAAAKNLRHQHEKNFVEKYRDVHRKRALGAAAVGAGWFTAIMVGGHMVTGFVDYQLHGSGGMMDKLNHLDNPNGPTPWKPTVGKPWWMW